MFSGFMVNTWVVASIVAAVAGLVGFFVVLRGSAFAAHAIPNGAFAGAAGASLVAVNTLIGLGVFAVLAAAGIAGLSRRGRQDVATALVLVLLLGLGALFLSLTTRYASQIYSLLFGEVLGISAGQLGPTIGLAAASVLAIGLLYRPLMLSSMLPEMAEGRGLRHRRIELAFLIVVALTTTMTIPVVGTLLIFSLMIGAPAAARSFSDRPGGALVLSVAVALVTVWASIAAAYATNDPVGFFVGTISAGAYGVGRAWAAVRRRPRRTTS